MVEQKKIWNFSAGPCILPKEVLLKAQADLIDYKGTGMSVMEMSHRGKPF
jgi:phosphoserine aminotransferase